MPERSILPGSQKKGPSAKTSLKVGCRRAMRTRACSLKASPVTPPPWRQRMRGDAREASGLLEDIWIASVKNGGRLRERWGVSIMNALPLLWSVAAN
jgi:hypothetical protein